MTDITPAFNEALKGHGTRPIAGVSLSMQHLDEFLKEAYRINSHIASLNDYLRGIRQSYLSTTQPPRRQRQQAADNSKPKDKEWRYLTDRQRDEIDAETKQLLRELNYGIRNLADAEQLRQDTETTLIEKKYGTKLGALGNWAVGGIGQSKPPEQEQAESRANTISTHRENVLWYLRQKLQQCGGLQAAMMETRIMREMEKNKSLLYKSKGGMAMDGGGSGEPPIPAFEYKGAAGRQVEEEYGKNVEDELTPEQLQLFEKENQNMVQHYEDTLNQVKTAQKSLMEISELQTQLVNNLATQSAHIDQLVADSFLTAENVGGGNKELKKASERRSTANVPIMAGKAAAAFFANNSSSSKSKSTTSATSGPQARLQKIAAHMSQPQATNFPQDAVPQAPEDPLFGLMAAYRADTFDKKVDLGIGAYRDDNAKPWVLPVVKKADEILRNDPALNHEYLPIAGLPDFTSAAAKVMLGADSPALKEKRVTSVQTISGTGACHLGGMFLSRFYKPKPTIYLSNPTWANHNQIFTNAGLSIAQYPYFSASTKGLDFDGMKKTLQEAPERAVILLHACAHNPTGVDPTQEQWKEIAAIMRAKKQFPFFDSAYQGFASGDLAKDAWAVRYFVEQGFEMCLAQSFAKNLGLYGERAGCFHFITSPAADASETISRIASQLAILQRSEISNPPAYGARIASTILNDAGLFSQWEDDLRTMSGRIEKMRTALRGKLEELKTPGSWSHITEQIGMFSFTGLTETQVLKIRKDAHVYMTKNGRISMAGLNSGNVEYVAQAIDKVVRETAKL
ncbi:hypothetical protein O988_00606 [Pseudogymnoascus sp. VKM F-3808]|nr:hypothetical protein O988_00606 [Pseudogymnoascus sp. VKM F-3808]